MRIKTILNTSFMVGVALAIASCASEPMAPNSNVAQRKLPDSSIVCFPPQPTFPGDLKALKSFINTHLQYPRNAGCFEGSVFIQFVVNEDGSLTDFKVVKGISDIVDQSAMSTLKKMPHWIPAMENGVPIKSTTVLPVKYFLSLE